MIFITGHKGFIGSRLTRHLEDNNLEYAGFDLKDGQDIRDQKQLTEAMQKAGAEVVIHMAALAALRNDLEQSDEFISTNVTGTHNVVEAAKQAGVKKLIFFSSSGVYGSNKDKHTGLKEDDELNPVSLYGVTKVAGELLVKKSGLDHVIIRPFTTYGEKGRPDMVIFIWLNLIKQGKPITVFYHPGEDKHMYRGFTYVHDLVSAVKELALSDKDHHKNVTLNLGGSENISVYEILDIIKKHKPDIKVEEKEKPSQDPQFNHADIARAKELVGWNPDPKFKQIVEEIVRDELKDHI